jgi:ribonuclease HIII
MTLKVSSAKFSDFKAYLETNGYSFEERPYQQFLAKKPDIVINLYTNGKVVFGGTNTIERQRVEEYLGSLGAADVAKHVKEYAPIQVSGTRIGTDEVGKGDYFGPLVIGGVIASEAQARQLKEIGVRDSKSLSDTTIKDIAVKVRQILRSTQFEVIVIGPLKYNMLHRDMQNVNGILGWGHARAIENLLAKDPACQTAIADQFGDLSYIERALMRQGKKVNLIQTPGGEREISVAAASVLARSEFIDRMREMSETYGMQFPKGSTNVIPTAERFVLKYGDRALLNVAKIHFSITRKIANVSLDELQKASAPAPHSRTPPQHRS